MEKETIELSDGVSASYHIFSEYIVCVEVAKNGEPMGSFCSDTSQIEELDEEEVISMIQKHIKEYEASSLKHKKKKLQIEDFELDYYSHSEDMYCIDVTKQGNMVGSFCADRASFEEWMDDEEQLTSIVKKMIT